MMSSTSLSQKSTNLVVPDEAAFAQVFLNSSFIVSKQTYSTSFVKKFLAVALSNIAYLRAVFPESDFADRYMGDLHLKIIRKSKDSTAASTRLIDFVNGCFDALENKYLKTVTVWFYEVENDPQSVMEAYIFRISYTKNEANVSVSHNASVVAETQTSSDLKQSTVSFLKALISIVEHLDPLPTPSFLKMQLTYYDDRTPASYQPKGFSPATTGLSFPGDAAKVSVGEVKSNHHSFRMNLRSRLLSRQRPSVSSSVETLQRAYGLDGSEGNEDPLASDMSSIETALVEPFEPLVKKKKMA